ncbi:MAG: AmmeMemoRadiSam system protein B [Oscillospiraceae bacterium]|nr:AmmeMemoRadiSam system protein B [Oscillospiraceae bacterium]
MRFLRRAISLIMIICAVILSSCEYYKNPPDDIMAIPFEGDFESDTWRGENVAPSDIGGENKNTDYNTIEIKNERRLSCKHTDFSEFYNSIQNPKEFKLNGEVYGGVVPHHMVAATLVAGFFKAVSETEVKSDKKYDTVVIVAPNHQGETGDIITSFRNWQIGEGETVYCDNDIVGEVYQNQKNPDGIIITENDGRMEEEHSVSVLIPYISHYLPETKVAAFLLNRRLTLENIYNIAKILSDAIKKTDKKVLFICCIDFSHYLPVISAAENDIITKEAIIDRDYKKIHGFSNDYVDSPQSLNTFLLYLENIGINNIDIIYNTDASEFLGAGINETTSYFIIAAYE